MPGAGHIDLYDCVNPIVFEKLKRLFSQRLGSYACRRMDWGRSRQRYGEPSIVGRTAHLLPYIGVGGRALHDVAIAKGIPRCNTDS